MLLNLVIPQDISIALKIPEEEKEQLLLTELAISLYQRGYLSFGKARELSKLSKTEFHNVLGNRKISRHYNEETFKEDLEYGTK